MSTATAERQRDGRSPCAGAKHNDPAHAVFPLLRVRAEAALCSGDKAANVLVVLEDDQEGDDDLRGDVGRGFISVHQEPGKDGKAGGAKNRGQGYIASEEQDDREKPDGRQGCKRRGDEEDAEAGRDAFAAAKVQPYREHVSENGGNCCDGLCVAKWHGGQQDAKPAGHPARPQRRL